MIFRTCHQKLKKNIMKFMKTLPMELCYLVVMFVLVSAKRIDALHVRHIYCSSSDKHYCNSSKHPG